MTNQDYKDIKARWAKKVDISGGCWEWKSSKNKKGYGHFWWRPSQMMIGAHRAAYMLFIGEIPTDLQVLHKCDNPSCVNPDHLFLGSNNDNVNDKVCKSRQFRPMGHLNHTCVLTQEQVLQIRKEYKPRKITYSSLAATYGVRPGTIAKIVRRENWGHI